eukprot:788993-Pleurochrysis_carterae.AAC.1
MTLILIRHVSIELAISGDSLRVHFLSLQPNLRRRPSLSRRLGVRAYVLPLFHRCKRMYSLFSTCACLCTPSIPHVRATFSTARRQAQPGRPGGFGASVQDAGARR